jgi:hypothetical protein
MLWPHTPSILGQKRPLASDVAKGSDLPESTAGSIQLCQARQDGSELSNGNPMGRSNGMKRHSSSTTALTGR